MRILAAVLLLLLGLAPAAQALTIRDLIELSRGGLGDEVLLALIEVDRGVYAIDAATLVSLKAAGVSDRVIAALVRSGREQPPPAPTWHDPPPPVDATAAGTHPQVVVIEHHTPQIVEVPVAVPVYVTTTPRRLRPGHVEGAIESSYVPFQSGPPAVRPEAPQRGSSPVYWGFGGQRRPDAWAASADAPRRASPPKRDRESEAPRSERADSARTENARRGEPKDSDGTKTAGRSPRR